MSDLSSTYHLQAPAREAVMKAQQDSARRRFLYALLLSTWIPMLFFLSLAQLETTSFSIRGIKSLFLFLGTAHVPATLFFYTDKNFTHIIRRHKARYIYFPIALTIAAGLVVAFSNVTTQAYLLLVFWGWQAFHYGRQNLGIYSFTSIAQNTGAPRKFEKLTIDLATICGILGTFWILGTGVAPDYLHGTLNALYEFGKVSYFAVIIFGIYVYAKNCQHTTALKSVFFWTLVLFFLPVYLSNNINVTFLSYAIAHGLQYIVFMGIVSINTEDSDGMNSARYKNGLKLIGLMIVLGLVFYNVDTFRALDFVKSNVLLVRSFDFLFGAVLGVTMAHFVIDAGAWRLSRQPQREYMSKSFGFVLKPTKRVELSRSLQSEASGDLG